MDNYKNEYSNILIEAKNLIFRGAPGTGKSYLAKEIATDIVSNGKETNYENLTSEQKKQIEFVQFHPSYDYTDFVEGLRPTLNDDGTVGFELRDGIFKRFVDRARENFENSKKSETNVMNDSLIEESLFCFLENSDTYDLKTKQGTKFKIVSFDNEKIYITKDSEIRNKVNLFFSRLQDMLKSNYNITNPASVSDFMKDSYGLRPTQDDSYYYAIYIIVKDIIEKKKNNNNNSNIKKENEKKYVFIIDEINRGEISKIFGELFFSIDPGYRGKSGEISTQYSNLHSDPYNKFYIPDNVYIIGTMNDIDRSVDSFDFAMRRRFRFIEIKANEHTDMLKSLGDKFDEACNRMISLNNAISEVEELNENYQIGASYFLKLKNIDYNSLWTDYLKPLLQEYIRGMYNEETIMEKFKEAYDCSNVSVGDLNEFAQNQ